MVKYEAGIDWRSVDVGVIGERKDRMICAGSWAWLGEGML